MGGYLSFNCIKPLAILKLRAGKGVYLFLCAAPFSANE